MLEKSQLKKINHTSLSNAEISTYLFILNLL